MPRIAHVISSPSGVGGAERVLSWLADGAAERSWDQVVINPFAADPEDTELAALCGAPVLARRCERYFQLPATRQWLAHGLREFRPDIVQVYLFHASVLVSSLHRPPGARLVLSHQHGDHFDVAGMRIQETIDRLAGRRYDRVVACSRAVESFLTDHYHYPAASVTCIRNGWAGSPGETVGHADRPTVISVANFRSQKGHDILLSAFDAVRREMPDAHLVLVGTGGLRSEIESRVSTLGLGSNVSLLGPVESVWPLLGRAHVFALASRYEPLGVVVLEAMAAGLPVVASSVGGIPELVKDDVTGRLVPPGDDSALAEALLSLLSSPDLRARLGAEGRRAAGSHGADRMVERYFALYGELLAASI